jgi:hypothetical protein
VKLEIGFTSFGDFHIPPYFVSRDGSDVVVDRRIPSGSTDVTKGTIRIKAVLRRDADGGFILEDNATEAMRADCRSTLLT